MGLDEFEMWARNQSNAQGNYWTAKTQASIQQNQVLLSPVMWDELDVTPIKVAPHFVAPAAAQTSNRNLLVLLTDV